MIRRKLQYDYLEATCDSCGYDLMDRDDPKCGPHHATISCHFAYGSPLDSDDLNERHLCESCYLKALKFLGLKYETNPLLLSHPKHVDRTENPDFYRRRKD